MSANGEFSSTIDYDFIGGGFVTVSGVVSGTITPILNFEGRVPIFAESTNNSISFTFSGGIQLPTIQAQAELDFDFTVSSTLEFGIQSYAFANTRIEFTSNSEVISFIEGEVDYVYPFVLESNITQFSLGQAVVSYDFEVDSSVFNYSIHSYDKIGKNLVKLLDYNNEILINDERNGVIIKRDGMNEVKILQSR
jgi:hypothetical protein